MTRVDKYVALTFRNRRGVSDGRDDDQIKVHEVLDRLWAAMSPAEVSEANRRLADLLYPEPGKRYERKQETVQDVPTPPQA